MSSFFVWPDQMRDRNRKTGTASCAAVAVATATGVLATLLTGTASCAAVSGSAADGVLATPLEGTGSCAAVSGASASGQAVDVLTGLISHWPFDSMADGVYPDTAGGSEGMVPNAGYTFTAEEGGVLAGCAKISVPDGGVETGAGITHCYAVGPFTPLNDGATVCGWIKVVGDMAHVSLIGRNSAFPTIGDQILASLNELEDGDWHFYAIRFSEAPGGVFETRIDDGAWSGGSDGLTSFTTFGRLEWVITSEVSPGNPAYDLYLDEMALWSRLLTDEEVDWLYNNGNGNAIPT